MKLLFHVLLLLCPCYVHAEAVAIPLVNESFESPEVAESRVVVDGWHVIQPGVEIIRGGHKPTVVTTGAGKQFLRFGANNQGGVIEQRPAGVSVMVGGYTVCFQVNRVFNDTKMTRPLTVELLAGERVMESFVLTESDIPNETALGTDVTAKSFSVHVAKESLNIGQPLGLRLSGGAKNGFGMVAIDDIRISYDADAKQPALYQFDVSKTEVRNIAPLPGMGGTGKDGTRYEVNGERWTRNGKAWYPVSGEFHYVRYPMGEWSHELAKMRALGVDVVATYVFWNHHENPQGTWNWQDRLNLRHFIETARDHGLLVWLRLGPYINAETKNGGIPEFANKGKRSNSPEYIPLVENYYAAVAAQVKDLFVKDGGPIVGIQLDNEFASGDPKHITRLKEIAIASGMSVPYWSVTANSRFERMTAIPLQGSYTYRGWEGGGGTKPTSGFSYSTDEWTANTDLGGTFYDTADYPRGFCELGTGSPMNGSSRFTVEADFVVAQAWDCVGRGTNYLGYYMFHGGTQYPSMNGGPWPITYDFQAPLGEFGQFRESARQYKRLHTFVREFADELTVSRACRDPRQNPDPKQTQRLRHIGRFHSNRGFWFVNNTQRNLPLPTREDVQVAVKMVDGSDLIFPSRPMRMPDRRSNVFPIGMDLGGIDLVWATVQPLAKLENASAPRCTVFWMPDWTECELCFPSGTNVSMESGRADITEKSGRVIARVKSAAERCCMLLSKGNASARVVLLTDEESKQATVMDLQNAERLLLVHNGEVTSVHGAVKVQGRAGENISVELFPETGFSAAPAWKPLAGAGGWARCSISLAPAPTAPVLASAEKEQWTISAKTDEFDSLSHAYLEIPYQGNEALLEASGQILTNNFHHGQPWLIDLKRYSSEIHDGKLRLRITGANATPNEPLWQPLREVVLAK